MSTFLQLGTDLLELNCMNSDVAATGGAFVVQLLDCMTTFTVSMLYLLMRSFSGLSLVKPFTSCAATGARFLVCLGRLDDGNVGALWLIEVSLACRSARMHVNALAPGDMSPYEPRAHPVYVQQPNLPLLPK